MVESYIHLSIIFPKAYEYTVKLEKRTSKMPVTSLISLLFLYLWEFERLATVTE